MTRLQGTLQFLARSNLGEQIQVEMSALGSDPHLKLAVLFDENNISLSSNKIEFINLSLNTLIDQLHLDADNKLSNELNEIRQRMQGRVWIQNSSPKIIKGVYPILLSSNPYILRSNKIGILYLEKDLSYSDKVVTRELLEQAFFVLTVLLMISLGIVFFLNRLITKRIDRLVSATADFAAGDSSLRANIEGNDEIAILASAFDTMADQVTASQERLKSANQRLQLIMDSTAEGIFGVDTNAICVFANNACLSLLGYNDVSKLIGLDMRTIINSQPRNPDSKRQRYEGRMFLPLSEGTPRHVDNEILFRDDGSSFHSEYWSYPLLENGNVLGAVVSILDITKRVNALQELAQYQNNLESLVTQRTKQLEISNRELSSYSYSIAHDLRTPLRAVTSFSQIILEDAGSKLNESELDALTRIVSAGKHMAELIDDILELSKLSRTSLQVEKINLAELAFDIFETVKHSYADKRSALNVQPNLFIGGDKTLISLVIENLINNAMKYHQGDTILIEIGATSYATYTEVYVKDNGIGFDMRFAQKIFKPFERLHNLPQYSGTGVGLSIVKRIIERHGGKIWVVSELNRGSTFYFSIPDNIEKHLVI